MQYYLPEECAVPVLARLCWTLFAHHFRFVFSADHGPIVDDVVHPQLAYRVLKERRERQLKMSSKAKGYGGMTMMKKHMKMMGKGAKAAKGMGMMGKGEQC